MRTYTRKRPHYELIEDVQDLCRLCLNKAVEAVPIFTEDPNNICATLALRIMICVGLEVRSNSLNDLQWKTKSKHCVVKTFLSFRKKKQVVELLIF